MPNKQQRIQNANNYHKLMREVGPTRPCPNCKQPLRHDDGHFAPPAFGVAGFFICTKPEDLTP